MDAASDNIAPEKACLNCLQPVNDLFCANCGQSTKTERYDVKYLVKKLQHTFDIDRGFFHTLWLLVIKPGTAIREYMLGKRIGFSNPFKLFLLTGALVNLLAQEVGFFTYNMAEQPNPFHLAELDGYTFYSTKYFSSFTLTALPVFSLFSYLLFARKGFNFIENFLMNVYVAVGQFALLFVGEVIFFLHPSGIIIFVYGTLNIVYNIWVLQVFFQAYKPHDFLRGIVAGCVPLLLSYLFNYALFKSAPLAFWEFIDRIFS